MLMNGEAACVILEAQNTDPHISRSVKEMSIPTSTKSPIHIRFTSSFHFSSQHHLHVKFSVIGGLKWTKSLLFDERVWASVVAAI